jgi:hypothetical protein
MSSLGAAQHVDVEPDREDLEAAEEQPRALAQVRRGAARVAPRGEVQQPERVVHRLVELAQQVVALRDVVERRVQHMARQSRIVLDTHERGEDVAGALRGHLAPRRALLYERHQARVGRERGQVLARRLDHGGRRDARNVVPLELEQLLQLQAAALYRLVDVRHEQLVAPQRPAALPRQVGAVLQLALAVVVG